MATQEISDIMSEEMRFVTIDVGGSKDSFAVDKRIAELIDELRKKNADDATATQQMISRAKLSMIDEFVEKVYDYGQGCDDGKDEFIEWCGYPVPSMEMSFSISVTCKRNVNHSDIESDIASALRDNSDIRDYYVSSDY